jgi:hypothetical protein
MASAPSESPKWPYITHLESCPNRHSPIDSSDESRKQASCVSRGVFGYPILDYESRALPDAEIKAIASGNPAVVEKIKVDTEVRKLDQLRAVHANQQRR